MEFSDVTIEWIRNQQDKLNVTNRELAAGVNVDETHISRMLASRKGISKIGQAAIFYFFEKKRLNKT